MERRGPEHRHVEVRFKGIELTAERVAPDGDVHQPGQRMGMAGHVARDEDRAGAGPPHRHAVGHALIELRDEAVLRGELADRRALAAGDDQRVDVIELLGTADVDGLRTDALESLAMLAEVALQAEDAGAS